MLEATLGSAWHHPAVCFVTVAFLLAIVTRRSAFVPAFVVGAAFVSAADALVSGAWSPIPSDARTPWEIAFVIAGDARFFALFERYRRLAPTRSALLRGAGLAFVVPLTTTVFIVSGKLPDLRTKFLFYEIAFFVFALALRFVVARTRMETVTPDADEAVRARLASGRRFVSALTTFVLVQYGLWATADMLLLAGVAPAALLRLTADVLYYGAFLPFVWWRAPDSPARTAAATPRTAAVVVAGVALSFVGLLGSSRLPAHHDPAREPGAGASSASASLRFVEEGRDVGAVDLRTMTSTLPVATIEGVDPYYGHPKRWRAIPIEALALRGFGREASTLTNRDFVLRATDGYATTVSGARLFEGGAHVAFEDLDTPGWEPIGPRRANPGPFYLVWSKPSQGDLRTHPRPWQLASIAIITFDDAFPHVRPPPGADEGALRGFETFRARCLACHAVNRAGGRVGPELNVPRNILEYRSESDVRAYVRDPLAFRYGAMPPHPDLSAAQLDELVAYLRVMGANKHDPDADGGSPASGGSGVH